MPRTRKSAAKEKAATKPSADKEALDIFAFRDHLRAEINKNYKSFREFALEKEEELGYIHSNTLLALSSNKRRPSAKVLHKIAEVLGVKFDKKREIVESYYVKS